MLGIRGLALGLLLLAPGACALPSPAAPTRNDANGDALPHRVEVAAAPAVFADPRRVERLMAAVPHIDNYLEATVERDDLVGLAAGLVIDDKLVWFGGYGHRNLEQRLPVEKDTAFGIGSITKSITATAVLMLRDRGLLDLDRPAELYLPALSGLIYPTLDSPNVTVRHLLTHTSGLPRMGNFPEYPRRPQSVEAFLASLKALALDRPPGVERSYSNLGFQVLGPLIASVSGEDHRAFISRELLEPAGMSGAAWTPDEVGDARLALPYSRIEGVPQKRENWRPGAADAAGGLYASIEDLAAFAILNLSAWPPGDSSPAPPVANASLREAHTFGRLRSFWAASGPTGTPARARIEGNGIGFSVYATCRHSHVVAHTGKTMGHRAALYMLPRHGVAVILLSNLGSADSGNLPRDAEQMLELLANTGALEPRAPQASPALLLAAEALIPQLRSWSSPTYARIFSASFKDTVAETTIAELFDTWSPLVGTCRGASLIEADHAYEATVMLNCAKGNLHLHLRIAPWSEHPITRLSVRGAVDLAPAPAVVEATTKATQLLATWDDNAAAALFAAGTDLEHQQAFLSEVRAAAGDCKLDTTQYVEPNGATHRLRCTQGPASMRVVLDEASRIRRFEIRNETVGPCD